MGVLVGSELLHKLGSGGGDWGSRARHGDVIVVSSGRRAGYTHSPSPLPLGAD